MTTGMLTWIVRDAQDRSQFVLENDYQDDARGQCILQLQELCTSHLVIFR